MCGIWFLISRTRMSSSAYDAYMKVSVRGPDCSNLVSINLDSDTACEDKRHTYGFKSLNLGFHRLSIMDTTSRGSQPFKLVLDDKTIYVMCNGEIYQYKNLIQTYNIPVQSESDCEILPYLYQKLGFTLMLQVLEGSEFSVIVVEHDRSADTYNFHFGRDPFGVRPLYYGINKEFICFSSELKGIPQLGMKTQVDQFPPGHSLQFNLEKASDIIKSGSCSLAFSQYYQIKGKMPLISDEQEACKLIRSTLTKCIEDRLESDRPLGALLSGGLDSSLVCAVASRYLNKKGQQLKTFSIGMAGGSDEKWAKMVAHHINSIHTHITLTEDDFLQAVPQVIKTIETYDTTTIRASTAQFLVSKWVRQNTNIKVLLIGDGSDEITAGYMYFHKAPDAESAHLETVRLVKDIHRYDGQRADRCISGNGIEARVPFLDSRFANLYFSIDPKLRIPRKRKDGRMMEKYLLRLAFSPEMNLDGFEYLPETALWRIKCAFSDACSSSKRSWYQIRQEQIKDKISDEEFETEKFKYNHLPPVSKEQLYDRQTFEHYYPGCFNVNPYMWLPKWMGNITEASARVLPGYTEDD